MGSNRLAIRSLKSENMSHIGHEYPPYRTTIVGLVSTVILITPYWPSRGELHCKILVSNEGWSRTEVVVWNHTYRHIHGMLYMGESHFGISSILCESFASIRLDHVDSTCNMCLISEYSRMKKSTPSAYNTLVLRMRKNQINTYLLVE